MPKTQWANGVRQAAAEARAALLKMASKQLGVPVTQLTVTDGVVSVGSDSSKKVSDGELIGGQRFNLTVTGKAPTKKPSEHKIVGKSIKRPEVPSKLNGRFTYIQDVKVAGMLHGRVVRPPSINATLVRVSGFRKKVRGLVKVACRTTTSASSASARSRRSRRRRTCASPGRTRVGSTRSTSSGLRWSPRKAVLACSSPTETSTRR